MRLFLLAPGLLMAAWSTAVFAAGLPTVMAIGSPLSALDREAFDCRVHQERLACQAQGGAQHYRGLAVHAMTLEYEAELLRQVTVLFDERQFEDALRQFEDEFGAGAVHDEKIRAGMAGVIVNRIRAWRECDEVRMLEQFSGRLGLSALQVFTAADFAAEMSRRQATRVRGLRDL